METSQASSTPQLINSSACTANSADQSWAVTTSHVVGLLFPPDSSVTTAVKQVSWLTIASMNAQSANCNPQLQASTFPTTTQPSVPAIYFNELRPCNASSVTQSWDAPTSLTY